MKVPSRRKRTPRPSEAKTSRISPKCLWVDSTTLIPGSVMISLRICSPTEFRFEGVPAIFG